jgi:phosphatidylethanolamine-binding protein (PEBP) family uncharacterized protein
MEGKGQRMRRSAHAATMVSLLSALVLTGCGTGSGGSGKVTGAPPTSSGKIASVRLTSSAIQHGQLAAPYTCAGKDISPPLTWGTVPSTVRELALFALEASSQTGHPPAVEWAVAGVKPALHHINAGELPRGAFLLSTVTGKSKYSLCPPKGQTKHYELALYALPKGATATPALSGETLLANLLNPNPQFQAPATGAISATYTRR